MKLKHTLIGCGLIFLFFVSTIQTSKVNSKASIVVDGADYLATSQLNESSQLNNRLDTIISRIVFWYADFAQDLALQTPSAQLESNLENIPAHIRITYSDTNVFLDNKPVPTQFETLLGGIPERIETLYPDYTNQTNLQFPSELIDDNSPPPLPPDDPEVIIDGSKITIIWNSDEFVKIVIRIGTSQGNYTIEITIDEFQKSHEIMIENLPQADEYFYEVTATDLSGNSVTSQEYEIEIGDQNPNPPAVDDIFIYLSLIQK